MSMSCGRWIASVMTQVMPLAASGCSRVRAPATPIWKSATYEWRARPICCLTSPYAILSSAPAAQGTLRVSSATLTTQIKSSRAPLLTRFATIVTHINAIGRWLSCRHACLPGGRIHGELVRLLFFLSNKQIDYFEVLGYQAHKEEFYHRRGVFFHRNRCTIGMACAQAVALRGAPTTARRHVPVPRGGGGGGRGAQRGVSNLPPGHSVADGFRWADRDASA
jgi:hypothetical protein